MAVWYQVYSGLQKKKKTSALKIENLLMILKCRSSRTLRKKWLGK